MVENDRRSGLFGNQLVPLGQLDADEVGGNDPEEGLVVLEIGTGRIAP